MSSNWYTQILAMHVTCTATVYRGIIIIINYPVAKCFTCAAQRHRLAWHCRCVAPINVLAVTGNKKFIPIALTIDGIIHSTVLHWTMIMINYVLVSTNKKWYGPGTCTDGIAIAIILHKSTIKIISLSQAYNWLLIAI